MGVTVVNTALAASSAVTRARASVVIVAPLAETSAALLSAATSVAIAGATVTLVVPVSSLSYISMASGAYLDTSGRFQYFANSVSVADVSFRIIGKTLTDTFGQTDFITDKAFALGKHDSISTPDFITKTLVFIRAFTDTFGFTDQTSFTFARPLADNFSLTDFPVRNFGKQTTDFFGLSDTDSLLVTKANADSLTVPDSTARGFTKARTDSFSLADSKSFLLARPAADSFTFTDSASRTSTKALTDSFTQADALNRSFTKARTDSFTLSDTSTRVATKRLVDSFNQSDSNTKAFVKARADAFTFTELLSRSLTRTIQDGFAMNDSADLADGITYQTVKYVNNLAFVTDAKVLLPRLGKTDTVSLVSAGLLTSQSYCDMSYFAEDYVGQSRTFS
jgi:hypothetical protein